MQLTQFGFCKHSISHNSIHEGWCLPFTWKHFGFAFRSWARMIGKLVLVSSNQREYVHVNLSVMVYFHIITNICGMHGSCNL